MTSPWAFHLHPVAWVVLLGVTTAYATAVRRPEHAVAKRQAWSFLGAIVVLLVALTWPLADLAAHRLLVALVVQRLLLMLAAPPLLLAGIPATLVARATRPAMADEAARLFLRPVPAIALVTVVAVATLTTPAVDAQASSPAVRAVLDTALLVAGLVLWMPVLRPLPGTPGMSALGRAGYLVVQSIVPSFLAIVWIFARHPLYPVYVHPPSELGWAPVTDQEIAGFVAKLGTIFVLWTVAFVVLSRSLGPAEPAVEEPLTWADVERHLQRAERAERSERSRRRASRWSAFLPDFGDPAARRSPGGTAPGEPTDEPGPAGHG